MEARPPCGRRLPSRPAPRSSRTTVTASVASTPSRRWRGEARKNTKLTTQAGRTSTTSSRTLRAAAALDDDAVVARPVGLAAADAPRAALLEAALGSARGPGGRTAGSPCSRPPPTRADGAASGAAVGGRRGARPQRLDGRRRRARARAGCGGAGGRGRDGGAAVEAAAAAAAAPPALARAWRRLAAIADADAADLRRAAAGDLAREPSARGRGRARSLSDAGSASRRKRWGGLPRRGRGPRRSPRRPARSLCLFAL